MARAGLGWDAQVSTCTHQHQLLSLIAQPFRTPAVVCLISAPVAGGAGGGAGANFDPELDALGSSDGEDDDLDHAGGGDSEVSAVWLVSLRYTELGAVKARYRQRLNAGSCAPGDGQRGRARALDRWHW